MKESKEIITQVIIKNSDNEDDVIFSTLNAYDLKKYSNAKVSLDGKNQSSYPFRIKFSHVSLASVQLYNESKSFSVAIKPCSRLESE